MEYLKKHSKILVFLFLFFLSNSIVLEKYPEQIVIARNPASENCSELLINFYSLSQLTESKSNFSELELKHEKLWESISSFKEFENFDFEKFQKAKSFYRKQNLQRLSTPSTIEEKLAFIDTIYNQISIQIKTPHFLNELEILKKKKLKMILKMIDNFEPDSKVSREDLKSFTEELFLVLKGPPIKLLDSFLEEKVEFETIRLNRLIQEEIFNKGLNGIINQFPEREQYTFKQNAKLHINRIVNSKAWRITSLPFDLPFIDQVQIPDELLSKILLDGYIAHEKEVLPFLQKVKAIDNYDRFRKVYSSLAFTATFSYFFLKSVNELNSEVDKTNEDQKKDFLKQFSAMAEEIRKQTSDHTKTDQEIKMDHYKEILLKFKTKNHEDPTPDELQEIQVKVFGKTLN